MKTRMKKDLLQGMLNYPAPASDQQEDKISDIRVKGRNFFQRISPQSSMPSRIKRKPTMIEPKIIKPDNRETVWQNLRKDKNI